MDLTRVVVACASSYVKDPFVGLLFVDTRQTEHTDGAELIRLMRHPDVKALFGTHVIGLRLHCGGKNTRLHRQHWWPTSSRSLDECSGDGFFITTDPLCYTLEVEFRDAPIFFRLGNTIVRAPTTDFTDRCIRLNKALGCDSCDLKGEACLWENLDDDLVIAAPEPDDPRQIPLPHVPFGTLPRHISREAIRQPDYQAALEAHQYDWEAWREKKVPRLLAGYTYVSSQMTSDHAPAPGIHGCRPPYDHMFTGLRDTQQRLSERSKRAAVTQKTIRDECSQCHLGARYSPTCRVQPCGKYGPRNCEHKHWTEKRLADYTLEHLKRATAGTAWHLATLWRLANVMGIPFKRPNKHSGSVEWVIRRLASSASKYGGEAGDVHVVASPTGRTRRRHQSEVFDTPRKLYAFLSPELKAIWDNPPPMNRTQFAMWTHVVLTHEGKGYATAHCFYYQPTHGYVTLVGSRGICTTVWMTTHERDHCFYNWRDMFSHYGDTLPWFSPLREESDHKKQLYASVR